MVTTKRFPRLRSDGSFGVLVTLELRGEPHAVEHRVRRWLNDWYLKNPDWTMPYAAENRAQIVSPGYTHEFKTLPVAHIAEDGLQLLFECNSGAKSWKDWVYRMVVELVRDVPGLGKFRGFRDCEEA
jgi:hypothetical protein